MDTAVVIGWLALFAAVRRSRMKPGHCMAIWRTVLVTCDTERCADMQSEVHFVHKVREGRVIQFFMKALHRSLRQIRVAYEAEYHRSMRLEAQVEYLKKLLDGILVERRLEREEMERGQQYLSDISGAYGEVCLMVMDMMVAALGDKVDEQITTAFAALEAATPGVPVTAPDACASSRLGLLRAWSLSGCGTTRSARR
ncbi:hypothetical protein PLESTF_001324900 [Pleodorina starrii]|nr:hypothetical protein PLESTF_001324900 [Pleodorina starrii]